MRRLMGRGQQYQATGVLRDARQCGRKCIGGDCPDEKDGVDITKRWLDRVGRREIAANQVDLARQPGAIRITRQRADVYAALDKLAGYLTADGSGRTGDEDSFHGSMVPVHDRCGCQIDESFPLAPVIAVRQRGRLSPNYLRAGVELRTVVAEGSCCCSPELVRKHLSRLSAGPVAVSLNRMSSPKSRSTPAWRWRIRTLIRECNTASDSKLK